MNSQCIELQLLKKKNQNFNFFKICFFFPKIYYFIRMNPNLKFIDGEAHLIRVQHCS